MEKNTTDMTEPTRTLIPIAAKKLCGGCLPRQTEGSTKNTKFVVSHTQDKPFPTNTYLSSCQNEFVSNSGSTSVAFMIRAATTALHIYRIKTTVIFNVLAMLPMKIKIAQWIMLL